MKIQRKGATFTDIPGLDRVEINPQEDGPEIVLYFEKDRDGQSYDLPRLFELVAALAHVRNEASEMHEFNGANS